MAAYCWTFIGSAVLCYAYAVYFISCAIVLTLTASSITATAHCRPCIRLHPKM